MRGAVSDESSRRSACWIERAMERRLLGVSFRNHINNQTLRRAIRDTLCWQVPKIGNGSSYGVNGSSRLTSDLDQQTKTDAAYENSHLKARDVADLAAIDNIDYGTASDFVPPKKPNDTATYTGNKKSVGEVEIGSTNPDTMPYIDDDTRVDDIYWFLLFPLIFKILLNILPSFFAEKPERFLKRLA
ncbi:unnamed protein product [Gongylonema pulchrum]|uniref:Bestrophin homolog n=1 Tax=Gongylonema pulchrum TaxID=637853 RepID=A0A183DPB6_9BILA|nr:unnamed protein product [Gongylonema pulchrum]